MNALNRTMLDLSAALSTAAAPQKQHVFICSKRYFTDPVFQRPAFRAVVLVGGEYFEVGRNELAALQAGISPEDLQLYPLEEN